MSKKIFLIILLFATITFGQYVAPNEDTVVVVGGLGTQADKNSLNGGGATKATWDAGSPSDFIGTNGGTITADTVVTYSNGTTTFSKTGIGTGVTVGTLAYVSGTNITAGIYEITARTNDTIVCANIVATGDNTDSVVNVGGALDGLQNALDNGVNNAASYNRYIYDNITTETISATIDADTYGGSVNTSVYIIGYNSTLAAEAQVIITTGTDLTTNALLRFTTVDYFKLRNIDFNAGGKDSNLGGYCIYALVAGDGADTSFYNCKFRGAELDGAAFRSNRGIFINCQFYLNGRYGFSNITVSNDGLIMNCSIHDNDNSGIHSKAAYLSVINNLIYDNGKDGTGHGIEENATYSLNNCYIGNTIYGNAGNGINFVSQADMLVVINNTSVGNGGYGYDFNGGGFANCIFFGYNHSSVNTTAHYDVDVDGTFAAFGNGSNKADATAAADIFTSVTDGSEDFTPKSGTDLIDNALDAGTN